MYEKQINSKNNKHFNPVIKFNDLIQFMLLAKSKEPSILYS
jgi:hypothetical protein